MSEQHYKLVEAALYYIDEHRADQPSLARVAAHIGLSEFHFQRLFSDWAGVSPKRFLQFLNREYLKTRLDFQVPLLQASLDAGLSGTSRSHDLFVTTEGMTPAQYRDQGQQLTLHYGFHPSPFGDCLLATCNGRICHMAFVTDSRQETLARLREDWSLATLTEEVSLTATFHARIFGSHSKPVPLPLLLRGTAFQLKVWEALLRIAEGEVVAYEQLALLSGQPAAIRAVASAVARNRIALLIPCHRVIRKIGETGEYRWGRTRKRLLLAREAAQHEQANR